MRSKADIIVKITTPVTEDLIRDLMAAFKAVAEVSILPEYVDVVWTKEHLGK